MDPIPAPSPTTHAKVVAPLLTVGVVQETDVPVLRRNITFSVLANAPGNPKLEPVKVTMEPLVSAS